MAARSKNPFELLKKRRLSASWRTASGAACRESSSLPGHQELFRQLLFQCPLGTRRLTSVLLCAALAQIFAQVAPVFQALGFCFPITAFVMKLVCHGASQTHVGFAGQSSAGASISYFCISGQRTRSLRSLLLVWLRLGEDGDGKMGRGETKCSPQCVLL